MKEQNEKAKRMVKEKEHDRKAGGKEKGEEGKRTGIERQRDW